MTDKIRIMLVDDHALCRSGLTELLEHQGDMVVVRATGDPEQVLPLLREHPVDLLVLDLRLGATDGLSLLRHLRAMGCDTSVVILTMSDSEDDLSAALRVGVRGYLLKDMEPEEVISSIRRAAHGELVVASAMTLKLAQLLQSGPRGSVKSDLVASLTEREREVLDHVARGQSNKVIAQALDISHNTVKLHVRHIMDKLNLRSRVEAAVFAFEFRNEQDGGKPVGETQSLTRELEIAAGQPSAGPHASAFPRVEPRQRPMQADDLSDDGQARRTQALRQHLRLDIGQRADDHSLALDAAVLYHGHVERRGRRHGVTI